MFHVKICGVTTAADARMAAAAGADAIGLNFVPGSPRCLAADVAREIVAAIPEDVLVVGVFAGADPGDIRRIVEQVGLDAVQLHGHLAGAGPVDNPETCAALAPTPVIRAVRVGADGFAAARGWIASARGLGHPPVMAVVDAAVTSSTAAGQLGGTGETVANVAEAIRATAATAVDTASGVESAPGRKDPEKMRSFCAAARQALAAVAP